MAAQVEFEKISTEESWKVFDAAARRLLKMPGRDVASRWDAGEFADSDSPDLMQVIMLRPSGG
jgi:hypothetical protein